MENPKITQNLKFTSDFGEVAYDLYEPEQPFNPPIIIQIAHGMAEHKGRYKWVASALAKQGYIVAISDHRGHGESLNMHNNITLGEMGEEGFERATFDLYKLNCTLKEKFSNAKVVLLGHSMGSLLARRYLLLYAESIEGLILSGSPAYHPKIKLGIAMGKVFRFFNMSEFGTKILNRFLFNGFYKKLTRHKKYKSKSLEWLCSDSKVVQDYRDDPKCNFRFSLQSLLGLFVGMKEVYNNLEVRKTNLPILLISGSDDVCGGFSIGVQKACQHLKAQGYEKVDIILYKGARHEILNEPIKQQVIADIILWIQEIAVPKS